MQYLFTSNNIVTPILMDSTFDISLPGKTTNMKDRMGYIPILSVNVTFVDSDGVARCGWTVNHQNIFEYVIFIAVHF